ncbi:MAG: M23 family metallopeptidase [Acidimicrobiales bacterium]
MSRRARSTLALVPTLAVLMFGGVWQARAQPAPPPLGPQQNTPTTNFLQGLLGGLLGTTTTVPAQPGSPAAPQSEPAPDAAPSPGPDGSDADETTERTIPPEAQAIINSVLRTGSKNTLPLLEALARLGNQGLTAEEGAIEGFGQFPVAGEAWWSDDWYEARFTPEFHFHQGTDIFAARGTPVRAPADGFTEDGSGGAGGLAVNLRIADGTYYYMAHLDSLTAAGRGSRVKQGEIVGFVGDSGNAVGGSPHVHFEVHPGGGGAVNPKPILDRWLQEAIDAVPTVISTFQGSQSRALTAAGMLRRMDTGSLGAPVSSDGPQLWATNLRRENGGIRLADVEGEGEQAAWDPRVRGAAARAEDIRRANQLARGVLGPLTPSVLNDVTGG